MNFMFMFKASKPQQLHISYRHKTKFHTYEFSHKNKITTYSIINFWISIQQQIIIDFTQFLKRVRVSLLSFHAKRQYINTPPLTHIPSSNIQNFIKVDG